MNFINAAIVFIAICILLSPIIVHYVQKKKEKDESGCPSSCAGCKGCALKDQILE